ncbi:MAG: YceH family protein [Phycisphaerales bacterium]
MIQLNSTEARVLGVLIEKAYTTPGQYPLTLNALVNGCNQKSNREPVVNFDEETVFDALDALRNKGLVRQVEMAGSRVPKFRQITGEALALKPAQLGILCELLVRGPQTVGELRGRATRIATIDSLEAAAEMLDELITREPTLVKRHPPPPGSRAELFEQLLAPGIHSISHQSRDEPFPSSSSASATPASSSSRPDSLSDRVDSLEQRLAELESQFRDLRNELS